MLLMVAIPIAGMLIFVVRDISGRTADLRDLHMTSSLTNFAVKSGSLIHELQKERGLSAGFIASKGDKFREDLTKQRGETDLRIKALKEYKADNAANIEGVKEHLGAADSLLERLTATRSDVNDMKLQPQESIAYFTKTISSYLDVVAQITILSRNPDITREAMAYYAFLNAKEQTGRERAILNGVFASNSFDDETYRKFVGIIAAQATFLDVFNKYANANDLKTFREKMNGPFSQPLEEMRKTALTKGMAGNFGILPEDWFKTITAKINAMKEQEDQMAAQMGVKADSLAGNAKQSLIFSAAIAGSASATAFLFAFIFMTGITTPLKTMVAMLRDIAEGEGDLTKRLDADRGDEIGEVCRWFNRFVDNVHGIISQVSETTRRVTTSATQLHNTAEHIATAAEEVACQSTTVATASEEMSATSNDISHNCSLAADVSNRASDNARGGALVVQETLEGMNNIATRVSESAQTVKNLGARSDQIGAIVGTIEDIADQTNLLALNAAIEAARAGEQGRGFAVVADEVRALAERTTRATKEIGSMIKGIQQETNGAVSGMENGVKEVERGMNSSRKSGEALQQILDAINDVTLQVHQIATAAEEQTAVTGEISSNINQITDVVQETAKGAHETAREASALTNLAADLEKLVGRFKL